MPIDFHAYPWVVDLLPIKSRLVQHITPILGFAKSTGNEIRISGSAILVKRRQGLAFVTARHVIAGFEELRAAEGQENVHLTYGRGNMGIGKWVVEYPSDDSIDIALLRVPRRTTPQQLGLKPWEGRNTPRRPVEVGDTAYALGFPGAARMQLGTQDLLGCVGVQEFVVSAGSRHFVMAPEVRPRVFKSEYPALARSIDRVGGLSGCPVLVFSAPRVLMVSERGPQWMDVTPEWELAGIVYEGGAEGINDAALFVSHTHHLDI